MVNKSSTVDHTSFHRFHTGVDQDNLVIVAWTALAEQHVAEVVDVAGERMRECGEEFYLVRTLDRLVGLGERVSWVPGNADRELVGLARGGTTASQARSRNGQPHSCVLTRRGCRTGPRWSYLETVRTSVHPFCPHGTCKFTGVADGTGAVLSGSGVSAAQGGGGNTEQGERRTGEHSE